MSRPSAQKPEQTREYKPDISTLLTIGHFYFALTRLQECTTWKLGSNHLLFAPSPQAEAR
jgi:hypothetical protein